MKAEVNDKIRIINKMNDWSMEYQEGDIFTVESTWYGGVNVTSKTGVPISLDEVEYEVMKTEDSSGVSGKEEKKVLLHADTKKGLIRALKAGAELFYAWEQEGQPGKIQILAEDQAVCGCRDREEIGEKIKELTEKEVVSWSAKSLWQSAVQKNRNCQEVQRLFPGEFQSCSRNRQKDIFI